MPQPFPKSPEDRKALMATLKAEAPELMADLDEIRKQFPGATLKYVKTATVERGLKSRDGWPVPDTIDIEQRREAERIALEKEKRRITKAKAKRTR